MDVPAKLGGMTNILQTSQVSAWPSSVESDWIEEFEAVRSGFERVGYLHGDSLQVLASLPAESVDMIMTSPPYEWPTQAG